MRLDWCKYLGDKPDLITATAQAHDGVEDIVFSFAASAHPDDHTRRCAADAAGVKLALHPTRRRRSARARHGDHGRSASRWANSPWARTSFRTRTTRSGFSMGDHHFVPGFPVMAWPMVEWVLDQTLRASVSPHAGDRGFVIVYDLPESTVTPLMIEVEQRYRGLKSFSLPAWRGRRAPPH